MVRGLVQGLQIEPIELGPQGAVTRRGFGSVAGAQCCQACEANGGHRFDFPHPRAFPVRACVRYGLSPAVTVARRCVLLSRLHPVARRPISVMHKPIAIMVSENKTSCGTPLILGPSALKSLGGKSRQ